MFIQQLPLLFSFLRFVDYVGLLYCTVLTIVEGVETEAVHSTHCCFSKVANYAVCLKKRVETKAVHSTVVLLLLERGGGSFV
jgi:hypothetical protein